MAKEIEPTPAIEGADAVSFLIEMNTPAPEEENETLEVIAKKDLPNLFNI